MMKKRYLSIPALLGVICLSSCSPSSITFKLDDIGENVSIHTDIQKERFIENVNVINDDYLHYLDNLNYRNDYSSSLPIRLFFNATLDKGKVDSYKVTISKNEDMSNGYSMSTGGSYADFYNAELGQTYYWQVSALSFKSEIGSFSTESVGPRNNYVDGIKNVRDIGGYSKIKQGLIYRGPSFEKYEKNNGVVTNITNKGKDTIASQLGIKTEVDLRKNLKGTDPIAENCELTSSAVSGVNYVSLPMIYGGNNILVYKNDDYDNPARIKDFFELLDNEESYPMYVHCSEGKDRTGCLAYLVEALMGEDEETLYRDYLFSNLANVSYSMKTSGIDGNYGKTLHNYTDGETLQEKTYNYLKDVIGVSQEKLDHIIEFLGK